MGESKGNRKRISVYDQLAPALNDIYCSFTFVGHYRMISPPTAIKRKRTADKTYHVNRALFGPEFQQTYEAFIENACFESGRRMAKPARLKSNISKQRAERSGDRWEPEWDDLFSTRPSSVDDVELAYAVLMNRFAQEVGVSMPRSPGPLSVPN